MHPTKALNYGRVPDKRRIASTSQPRVASNKAGQTLSPQLMKVARAI
jgi:hypothetical protein